MILLHVHIMHLTRVDNTIIGSMSTRTSPSMRQTQGNRGQRANGRADHRCMIPCCHLIRMKWQYRYCNPLLSMSGFTVAGHNGGGQHESFQALRFIEIRSLKEILK